MRGVLDNGPQNAQRRHSVNPVDHTTTSERKMRNLHSYSICYVIHPSERIAHRMFRSIHETGTAVFVFTKIYAAIFHHPEAAIIHSGNGQIRQKQKYDTETFINKLLLSSSNSSCPIRFFPTPFISKVPPRNFITHTHCTITGIGVKWKKNNDKNYHSKHKQEKFLL